MILSFVKAENNERIDPNQDGNAELNVFGFGGKQVFASKYRSNIQPHLSQRSREIWDQALGLEGDGSQVRSTPGDVTRAAAEMGRILDSSRVTEGSLKNYEWSWEGDDGGDVTIENNPDESRLEVEEKNSWMGKDENSIDYDLTQHDGNTIDSAAETFTHDGQEVLVTKRKDNDGRTVTSFEMDGEVIAEKYEDENGNVVVESKDESVVYDWGGELRGKIEDYEMDGEDSTTDPYASAGDIFEDSEFGNCRVCTT